MKRHVGNKKNNTNLTYAYGMVFYPMETGLVASSHVSYCFLKPYTWSVNIYNNDVSTAGCIDRFGHHSEVYTHSIISLSVQTTWTVFPVWFSSFLPSCCRIYHISVFAACFGQGSTSIARLHLLDDDNAPGNIIYRQYILYLDGRTYL